MASFFQPSLTGPDVDVAPGTKFAIVWNATLKGSQLTLYWYQTLVITVGCTFFVFGLANLILQYTRKKRRLKRNPLPPSIQRFLQLPKAWSRSRGPSPNTQKDERILDEKAPLKPLFSPPKLSLIKTFCVSEHEIPVQRFRSNFDLHVIGLTGERVADSALEPVPISPVATHSNGERPPSEVQSPPESAVSSRRLTQDSLGSTAHNTARDSMHPPRASADVQDAGQTQKIFYGAPKPTAGLSGKSIQEKAALIKNLRLKQGLHGVVILYDASNSAEEINALLEALRNLHVSTILMGDPDLKILESVHFGLMDGLIVQNASVLPDGQRRDFFRAVQVRECVARCKRQMKLRPEFFMGFLEMWTVRPSAATLRRAFKLADFFGAVIQAQATSQHNTRTDMCLSGFDWLKRPEIVYLQKCWTENPATKEVSISDTGSNHLDIQKLSEVLGPTETLLAPAPLPPDLLLVKDEHLEQSCPWMDIHIQSTGFYPMAIYGLDQPSLSTGYPWMDQRAWIHWIYPLIHWIGWIYPGVTPLG